MFFWKRLRRERDAYKAWGIEEACRAATRIRRDLVLTDDQAFLTAWREEIAKRR